MTLLSRFVSWHDYPGRSYGTTQEGGEADVADMSCHVDIWDGVTLTVCAGYDERVQCVNCCSGRSMAWQVKRKEGCKCGVVGVKCM